MRVIAGDLGGRPLAAPAGLSVRPTSDRVREAIFNSLYSLGGVEQAEVLDLFAGTGALGIEALSRGAAHATFVENDATARVALEENLVALDLTGRARVVPADAMGFVARAHGPFALALCDPPYGFERWPVLLDGLRARRVVIESDRAPDRHPRWRLEREKGYGATVVSIMSRTSDADEEDP